MTSQVLDIRRVYRSANGHHGASDAFVQQGSEDPELDLQTTAHPGSSGVHSSKCSVRH